MQTSSTEIRSFQRRTAMAVALGTLFSLAACMSTPGESQGESQRAAKLAPNEKIIISGASGQLGGLVVKELLARGVPAKNLILVSRTPEELDEYKRQGASTRFGDFSKPESLPAAYAGGTRMLLISIVFGAGPRPEAHKRAIDAAVTAGVKHIAYTSYVAISRGDTAGLASDHYQTEEIVKKSGLAWTLLRNSIYSDGLVQQAAKMIADGKVTVPANDGRIGYVTREDCAAAAAAVLLGSAHENKAYDITGPELIGTRETATIATEVTGKPIEIVTADPNAPPPGRAFGGPAIAVTSNDVAMLTGRPATSVRKLFEAHKSELLGAKSSS
jgi:NAD(P)H dehydrogenase (quinone)